MKRAALILAGVAAGAVGVVLAGAAWMFRDLPRRETDARLPHS